MGDLMARVRIKYGRWRDVWPGLCRAKQQGHLQMELVHGADLQSVIHIRKPELQRPEQAIDRKRQEPGMTHDKVIADLKGAAKSGALDKPPRLTGEEIAWFCERLARSAVIEADDLMMFAEDVLVNEGGSARAKLLLDGMRAGIQQARAARADGRVVAIWFDDNASRAMFSWDGDKKPHPDLRQAITRALDSALRPNGDTTEREQ